MNSAQMMLKVISVFLSCRFISIAFASLVFITSTFANESILSIIKRQYGYGSIPFGVEYRRNIDGTFPESNYILFRKYKSRYSDIIFSERNM